MNRLESNVATDGLVLLVDDDREWCAVYKAALEALGVRCLAVFSIDEAASALKNNKIRLVLLDWRLKETSGERSGGELLRMIRESDRFLPVIVMSGVPLELGDTRTDAIMSQADGFFQKPMSPGVLARHLERWFARTARVTVSLLPESVEQVLPLEEVKRSYIGHVFELVGQNVSLAAKKLGIHRHTVSAATSSGEGKKAGGL